MNNKFDFIEIKDLPYTIIGHNSLPRPEMHITLTGEGVRAIANKLQDDDDVRIELWEDVTNEGESKAYYQRISIIRKLNGGNRG